MERFPQDLPWREMRTAEASFHSELGGVSPGQVLRALVEHVDLACGDSANFLGRLTGTDLIKAGPVYVNKGDPAAGFNPHRSPVAASGSGVNALWQTGVNTPYRPNRVSAYSYVS